ncbi:MAG: DUF1580 domain-containing protein [Phycisphaerales bacterium]|nr:DUF1580 domain-containing protein [Phycisphaerales bacterium]
MAAQTLHPPEAAAEYIGLADAAKLAPGRPSTNCLWRWCRRGVIARGGERVRLQHVRAGGKIFTTAPWVDEFVHRLASADEKYFNETDGRVGAEPPPLAPARTARRPRVLGKSIAQADGRQACVRERLREAGL